LRRKENTLASASTDERVDRYGATAGPGNISLKEAVSEAFHHKGFWLLGVGYFTCGFQIVFVCTHFPAFLLDQGLSVRDGTVALALIGLFNVFGSYTAGVMGGHFSKTYLLSSLYAVRIPLIGLLLAFPVTPLTAYLFAAVFGFTWLATVPLIASRAANAAAGKNLGDLVRKAADTILVTLTAIPSGFVDKGFDAGATLNITGDCFLMQSVVLLPPGQLPAEPHIVPTETTPTR